MTSFFSPNSKKTGGALFANFNSKDGAFYFKMMKQTSWDEVNKEGGFKGGVTDGFKFSPDEACSILYAIRTNGAVKFYHEAPNKENNAMGYFNYYFIEASKKEGFGISMTRNNVTFKVAFTLASAERFAEYIRFGLTHIFECAYRAEQKRNAEYLKSKENQNKPKEDAGNSEVPAEEQDVADF